MIIIIHFSVALPSMPYTQLYQVFAFSDGKPELERESEQLLEVASDAQPHELQLLDDDSNSHDYVNILKMFPDDPPQVCFSNDKILI